MSVPRLSTGFETSNRYRIPARDGITLGATITRPLAEGAFPALVWYDPYRGGIGRNHIAHGTVFRRAGICICLLERTRDGKLGRREQRRIYGGGKLGTDTTQSHGWAGQPWCSGRVGMLGTSYSGFTTLQVAATAPPALKAIRASLFYGPKVYG